MIESYWSFSLFQQLFQEKETDMKYLSTNAFLRKLEKDKRYCFILGSGASISSGIPTGAKLMDTWIEEIKQAGVYTEEIDRRINILEKLNPQVDSHYSKYRDPAYQPDITSSLEDYSRICELRFADNPKMEREYLYNLMNGKLPYIGYWALANILTRTDSKFVITTNFDELVETAIRDYTDKEPTIISHEAVSPDVPIELMPDRPRIMKVHRDITTGPFNTIRMTEELKPEWKKALNQIFKDYIPIVVGYAGTDQTLTKFLLEEAEGEGIYWCHMYGELPNKTVEKIVKQRNGNMVEIWEFDHIMLHMASLLCDDKIFDKHIIGEMFGSDIYQGYTSYHSYGPIGSLRRLGKEKNVRQAYKKALKRAPTPISYIALFKALKGSGLVKRGKFEAALKAYENAFNYEMKKNDRYYGKAKFLSLIPLIELNRVDEAEAICDEVLVKDFPDAGNKYIRTRINIKYIQTLVKVGKRHKACDVSERLLEYHRCDGDIYRVAAIAEFAHGNDNKAIEYVNCAIECDTNDAKEKDIGRGYLLRAVFGYVNGNDHVDEDINFSLSHGYYNSCVTEIMRHYSKEKILADRTELLQMIIGKVSIS